MRLTLLVRELDIWEEVTVRVETKYGTMHTPLALRPNEACDIICLGMAKEKRRPCTRIRKPVRPCKSVMAQCTWSFEPNLQGNENVSPRLPFK